MNKGDLVEFKPGLFGINQPQNYGIFIRRFRNKNTKKHVVELYTLRGKQQTSQSNIDKKNLGKTIPLKNDNLPETKIVRERLETWIKELQEREKRVRDAVDKAGELSEQGVWRKIQDNEIYLQYPHGFTIQELASLWFDLPEEEISRNRIKKISEKISGAQIYGQGYFDLEGGKPPRWQPISEDDYKHAKHEIGLFGNLRNRMFELVEMPVEDAEDPDETEMVRTPVEWNNIHFTPADNELISKMQDLMAFFVINDTWPADIGLGGTHIFAIDGFSLKSYLSYLAEDWINEGRTSYSDAFVKFLIRTNHWNDTDALLAISQRNVKLAKNFDWDTDERMERIASEFVEPKETPEVFEGRTNLTKLDCYTIDPPTAKDFDDAISLVKHKEGYTLYVHIADVAHYVKKDTSLDLHARRRATSVYLPTKTLPMLPTHLSDNLCSLREQVPRLAMTVEIHYDKQGQKILDDCKVHNSVIEVKQNLSYDYVNDMIERKENPFYSFHKFGRLINKHRRGLALETDDVRLELGGQMELTTKTSSPSTKMIETFMVAANETVAEILQERKLPVIYRNHPLPDKEDVIKFNAQSKALFFDFEIDYPDFSKKEEKDTGKSLLDMLSSSDKLGGGGNITFSLGSGTDFAEQMKSKLEVEEDDNEEVDLGTPFVNGLAQLTSEQQEEILQPFRKIIGEIEKFDDEYEQKLGYLTVLRTLSRALYGAGNMGHFGLGSTGYVHFTSPIRRYPDIIAHRVCKAMLLDGELSYTAEEIDELAIHCTEQSEIAEKLEKTIIGAGFSFLTRNPQYTENRQGIVISIFGGGVFVLLPNGIEARIPLSKMTDKPTFVDDYETMCFVGSRSDFNLNDEITPDNWKEMLGDDEEEPIQVIAKIGDKIAVDFIGWNHVEGKVEAAPVRILERVPDGYEEVELELEEE